MRFIRTYNFIKSCSGNTLIDHYVVVTGIIIDEQSEAIILKISSWGDEYFISFKDHAENTSNLKNLEKQCAYVISIN